MSYLLRVKKIIFGMAVLIKAEIIFLQISVIL